MALVLRDRVKETTTTTGTGTVTLAGAVTGFQSFSVVGNANTTYYCIAHQTANEWEVGIGTYTAAGTLLARTTVLESSNAGALVTFSAGTKDVFVTYPAERAIYADGTVLQTTNSAVLPIASGGSGTTTAQLAMNAFAGAVTSGQYLRGNGTNVVMSAIQAADVPTLNQNTTGSAATLTTARTINEVSFNGSANITVPRVKSFDDRTTAPIDVSAGYATFAFSSWANNNTAPYADSWIMRSYTDASGGNDNMVSFRKDALGMRIWQQTYGSATAFATYKDVAWTDGTNATGTWGITTTGNAANVTGIVALANGGTGAATANAGLNNLQGYTTTATAAGTTTLTAASSFKQYFTGTTTQTVVMPDVTTLALGRSYEIINNSTGTVTVQSSGLNTIVTIPAGISGVVTCILVTGTTAASWHYEFASFDTITGSGACVFATSPTLVTPSIGVATGTSFNSITALSSTTPIIAGTAAVGTSTTVARADHVHPAQTTITGNAGTATTATNLAGGAANQIHYNTAASTSAYITAPTTASTFLQWNGSAFVWAGAGGGAAITNDTTTNATYYPSFLTATSGSLSDIRVSSTKLTFNPSTGALTSTSHVSSSDERLKTNWRPLQSDFVRQLACVKRGVYDRNDAPVTQVGVSAQSLAAVLKHAVIADKDGMLSVEYGNAALVSAIELAELAVAQEARIAKLEALVAQLTKGNTP